MHLPSMHKIARMDSQYYKFTSLVMRYDKSNFQCEEQESFEDVLYIQLTTILCNLSHFVTLVVYRKKNSNIVQLIEYITNLATKKYVDFIIGDFNEDSLIEEPIKLSLQSIGFFSFSACVEKNYIRNAQNKISLSEVKVESVYFLDHMSGLYTETLHIIISIYLLKLHC